MKSSNTIKKIRLHRILHKIFTIYLPKLIIMSLILGILFVFINFFRTSNYFAVKSIDVAGINKYVSMADFTNVSNNLFLNKNILTIDTKKSEQSLKATFLGIKDLKVSKDLPDKIKIELKISDKSEAPIH